MTVTKVCFIGGGGHASDVWGLIEDLNSARNPQIKVVAIVDSTWERQDRFAHEPVDLITADLPPSGLCRHFISTIGSPGVRETVANAATVMGLLPLHSLIHPKSNVHHRSSVGDGSVVLGYCSVHRGSRLGKHVYLSHGCLIGHDVQICDYSNVLPGAIISGDVSVGHRSSIGSGAIVLEGLTISDNATVGAGAVVTCDVLEGQTVIGAPARPMEKRI